MAIWFSFSVSGWFSVATEWRCGQRLHCLYCPLHVCAGLQGHKGWWWVSFTFTFCPGLLMKPEFTISCLSYWNQKIDWTYWRDGWASSQNYNLIKMENSSKFTVKVLATSHNTCTANLLEISTRPFSIPSYFRAQGYCKYFTVNYSNTTTAYIYVMAAMPWNYCSMPLFIIHCTSPVNYSRCSIWVPLQWNNTVKRKTVTFQYILIIVFNCEIIP